MTEPDPPEADPQLELQRLKLELEQQKLAKEREVLEEYRKLVETRKQLEEQRAQLAAAEDDVYEDEDSGFEDEDSGFDEVVLGEAEDAPEPVTAVEVSQSAIDPAVRERRLQIAGGLVGLLALAAGLTWLLQVRPVPLPTQDNPNPRLPSMPARWFTRIDDPGPDPGTRPDPATGATVDAARRAAQVAATRRLIARSWDEESLARRESDPDAALGRLLEALALSGITPGRQEGVVALTTARRRQMFRLAAPVGFVPASAEVFVGPPVTAGEYLAFLLASGRPRPAGWPALGVPGGQVDAPVVGVAGPDAVAYATHRGARLPTDFELAATGAERRGPEWVRSADGTPRQAAYGGPDAPLWFRLALRGGQRLKALEPPRVLFRVRLESTPPGATVTQGGRTLGRTPLVLELVERGARRWVLSKADHLSHTLEVTPRRQEETHTVHLFPLAVVPAPLRDYATNPTSLRQLVELAERHLRGGRQKLGWTLLEIGVQARPTDAVVLRALDRQLAAHRPDDPRRAAIRKHLAGLEGKVDAVRTARFKGEIDDGAARLKALGVDAHQGMIEVPAGKYRSGSERPRPGEHRYTTRHLKAYWIDRTEVTVGDYVRFLRATGHPWPAGLKARLAEALLAHPVTGVTLDDARAYARWVGKRLPTELEWEKAARGPELFRRYPWGQFFDVKAVNCKESRRGGTTPVGVHPRGVSAVGCHDMAGNVWEWTSTRWSRRPSVKDVVIRGGSFRSTRTEVRIAARQQRAPGKVSDDLGFRLAMDP